MKAKLVSKIFVLFFCLPIFVSVIAAQEKPQAIKVGEYSDESANLQSLGEKFKEFTNQVSKEPETKGVIAFYWGDSFLHRYSDRCDEVYKFLETLVGQEQNSIKERIARQEGGRSLNRSKFAKVEFWIVPKGADKPDTREYECGLVVCPTLEITGEKSVENTNEPQIYTANVSGGSASEIEYKWTVSEGKIIKGQGTPVIRVDLSQAKAKEVKITVELDGVSELCVHQASFTTNIR